MNQDQFILVMLIYLFSEARRTDERGGGKVSP